MVDKIGAKNGKALDVVLYLETEAERFHANDPKAELLWQAANLLRQIHGLGDGEYVN